MPPETPPAPIDLRAEGQKAAQKVASSSAAGPAPWDAPGWYRHPSFIGAVATTAGCIAVAAATGNLDTTVVLSCLSPIAAWGGLHGFGAFIDGVTKRKD